MPTNLLTKGLAAPAKATPKRAVKLAPEGIVTAIVAVTGVVDAVGDLIVPGAFAATLKKRNPKVVDDHEWKRKAGRTLHVEEWMPGDKRLPKRTKDGRPWPAEAGALVATMQYNMDSTTGRESYGWVKFYAEVNEAEFSIGYKVPDSKARKRHDDVRVILMVDLYEFSHVLFGAAPLSMALEVKNLHGGAAGAVTLPAAPGPGEKIEDEPDETPANPLPDEPWEDDDERPRASMEAKTAFDVLMEAKDGGWDRNEGNAENLRRWFREGADGQIPWGSPGDFDACVAVASKHMTAEQAKGYCNLRHHEALGVYPATHAAMEGKSVADQEVKSMSRMKGSYEERRSMIEQAAQDLFEVHYENPCVCLVATYDTEVVVTVYGPSLSGDEASYLLPYSQDPETGKVDLGTPSRVELSLVAEMPSGPTKEAGEDLETVTVVGPMLETLAHTEKVANLEGKVGKAVRARLKSITDSLAGKSLLDDEEDEPDPSEDLDQKSVEDEDEPVGTEAEESEPDVEPDDDEDDDPVDDYADPVDEEDLETKSAGDEERVKLDPKEHFDLLDSIAKYTERD